MIDRSELQQVIVDITISAPVDEVWKTVRDPEAIANWFGWDAESLADEIDFIFFSHAVADDGARSVHFMEGEDIFYKLELTQAGGQTQLRLVSLGAPEIDWSGVYEDLREGWVTFFEQLRFALERHPGQRRRTFYLGGAARTGTGDLRSELGLDAALTNAPGEKFSTATPPGKLTGEIWHKTHFQAGVTVNEWGDGLLVVTDKGVAPGQTTRSGAVIATTYGLSDDDFARLEERWSQWWHANHVEEPGDEC